MTSLIARIRHQKIDTPVLILSAKRSVDERVRGLQIGGDDYLTKPFHFSELLARVQALIRRSSGSAEDSRLIWDFHFDPQTNVVDVLISWAARSVGSGSDRRKQL